MISKKFLLLIPILALPFSLKAKQNMRSVVQLGHSAAVVSVAFSPDGRFVLSGSDDQSMKLWEVSTGREIRTFKGIEASVTAVAYSPDGRIALAGYMNGTLTFWDVSTGRSIRSINAHSRWVQAVAFSPDGRKAFSGSNNRNVRVWEVSTGRMIRSFRGTRVWMQNWASTTIAFSPDGRFALLGSMDTQIWDIGRGRKIQSLPLRSMAPRFGNAVNDSAFSPDGRFFLLGGTGLELREVSTGREIRTFEGRTYEIQAVAYSPDGQFVMTAYKDGALILWDVSTGREIRSLSKQSNSIQKILFSPDGRFALSGHNDGTMILWEVSSGRRIKLLKGSALKVRSIAYSPDGRLAVAGTDNGIMTLWDVSIGQGVRMLKGHRQNISTLAFSPDGSAIISGGADQMLKLWDASSGQNIRTFQGHLNHVTSVAFSPDGNLALSGSKDETCRLWKISTGKEIRTLKGHSHWVTSVAFSPDGRLALSGSSDNTLKLWDISTGQEIQTFNEQSGWIHSVAFSPNGRLVLSGSWQVLTLWDVASGRKIRTIKGHSGNVTAVEFSSDGRYILSGSDDHTVKLWKASSGRKVKSFRGHLDAVHAARFSPDGRYVLSGSDDMTSRIWDAKTGKEVVRMVCSPAEEWITVTPDGYYNTSPEGASLIYWVYSGGMETFTSEQFESRFKRPDIIKNRLSGDLKAGKPTPAMTRPPSIAMPEHLTIKEIPLKNYSLTLTALALREVKVVRLFVNGKPVQEVFANARQKELTLDIPLFFGANRITAVAYDDKGFSSNPRYVDVNCKYAGLAKPNLYVVSVGISRYPGLSPRWPLEYAHTDAQSLAEAFQDQEGKMFGEVHHNLLINEKATVERIGDVLDSLSKVNGNDLVVIFMAGHGVKDKDKTFYFLTSEGSLQDPSKGGVSWSVLGKRLARIKGRVILLLDACHSGSIVTETVVPNDELAHKFFAEGRGGVMAFSASKGRQFSMESPDIGGGYGIFTYAVVQGMGPKANEVDTNGNKFVEFMELVDYVTEYVNDMTNGEQTPWLSRKTLFGDLPVASVN